MTSSFIEIHGNDVRFLADAHFRNPDDTGEKSRRRRFLSFLDSLPPGCVLFLLGDIFDFYFEYRQVVSSRYMDIYAGLSAAGRRGVDIHFLGGNHDFWVGSFAERELGLTMHRDEILVAAQGRRIVCAHGDLVIPRDWGYKILKSVIRNPAVIAVSRWIHPDLFDMVATGVSHGSRRLQSDVREKRAAMMREHAHGHFFTRGNDAFIMGHIHYPLLDRRDEHDFVLLGDWIADFSYAKLVDGKLTLEVYEDPS